MKAKSELMRNTRANRKKDGLVELRLWITPEQKERAIRYVTYLQEIEGGCFCEKNSLGIKGKTCGDCPRDYAKAQIL